MKLILRRLELVALCVTLSAIGLQYGSYLAGLGAIISFIFIIGEESEKSTKAKCK